jgi:hypothetical protein
VPGDGPFARPAVRIAPHSTGATSSRLTRHFKRIVGLTPGRYADVKHATR